MNLEPTNPPLPAPQNGEAQQAGLTPPSRGTGQPVLLPSWEGLGVGSGAQCAQEVRSGLSLALSSLRAPQRAFAAPCSLSYRLLP